MLENSGLVKTAINIIAAKIAMMIEIELRTIPTIARFLPPFLFFTTSIPNINPAIASGIEIYHKQQLRRIPRIPQINEPTAIPLL
jgi:hypothetical protein